MKKSLLLVSLTAIGVAETFVGAVICDSDDRLSCLMGAFVILFGALNLLMALCVWIRKASRS